jgi:hypothetical protein
LSGTPVAVLILLDPGVQFKAIESDALDADGNLGQVRTYLGIKPVAVHAEIERRVANTDEPGQQRESFTHLPLSAYHDSKPIRASRKATQRCT